MKVWIDLISKDEMVFKLLDALQHGLLDMVLDGCLMGQLKPLSADKSANVRGTQGQTRCAPTST